MCKGNNWQIFLVTRWRTGPKQFLSTILSTSHLRRRSDSGGFFSGRTAGRYLQMSAAVLEGVSGRSHRGDGAAGAAGVLKELAREFLRSDGDGEDCARHECSRCFQI